MSVRFLLGKSGTGKTEQCFSEVRAKLKMNPAGAPLIYLVPDHMTFDTEYELARTSDIGGMTRLNVYSFSRLALRVLQQTGGVTRFHINKVGTTMLLRKIVEQNKKRLRVFQKAAGKSGFYDLLEETMTELKRYCLTPEQVKAQIESLAEEGPSESETIILHEKLHDIHTVYDEFEQAMAGKYTDSEDYLRLLAEKIGQADFFKEAEVWIDGFSSMAPQELLVVEKLMEAARRVTIAIGADKIYDRSPDELSVYYRPALTFLQLKERAAALHIPIESIDIRPAFLRSNAAALKHLAFAFEQHPYSQSEDTDGLTLTEAVNRREEIEQAARDILTLVRDHGMRFRDMTVLVRDLGSYHELIETIFADYRIPVFIDQKRPMRHHPLIEFVRSLLETIQQNWRYDPIFRCIKTDLLLPEEGSIYRQREWLDQLENYVVAYGIYGSRWTDNKPWRYKKYRGLEEDDREQSETELELERRINQLRFQVAEPLEAFEKAMKSAHTVREKCTVLYQFLIELSIPEKMEKRQKEAEQAGRLDEAKEHAQVWRAVMDTLDQCVEVAGDEEVSLELFTNVIDTGLDELQFALVPPAIDQVLAGSLDRMRSSKLHAVFILGINEGILPGRPAEDGLFSDADRDFLEDRGMHIAEDTRGKLLGENELIFRSLTLSKERLYLSYPLASEDGQTLAPSPLINRLKRLFPTLKLRLSPSEPRSLPDNEQLGFVAGPGKTLGYLATQIREWRRGYPISDLWWEAYNWFVQNERWAAKATRVLSALFYRNEAAITAATAQKLYGRTIQASVSRMEKFSACPFSQFVSYGLKLQEREVFQLAAPDIGQLFHSALKIMTAQIVGSHQSWAELSSDDCERLALKTVRGLAPKLQRQILMSSSRHRYLQHKLEQVVARAAKAMRYHAQYSGFSPIGLELPFGPGRPLPALSFKLANGCTMQIVGRIDRVDKGEKDGGILLRIIDYKSGDKDLSLSDVYYGLALQMITYLDVIITNAKDWLGAPAEPAGVLYFHVHNPLLKVADKLPDQELEQQLLKSFKMKGLLLADEQVVREMDQGLEAGYSSILPVGVKRGGGFYSRSSVAGIEGFEALRRHVRRVMQTVGTDITNGDVRIAPYKIKDRMPCTYCSFRAICQFDSSKPGNAFRLLKKEPDEQVLGKLLTERGAEDGGNNEKA